MLLRGGFSLFASVLLLASIVGCAGGNSTLTPAPVARPTMVAASPAATPTGTPSPVASATATASPVPTATATSSASAGPTPTASPTANPSAPPVVTSISPTSGPVGSMITINGSGFNEVIQVEFTGGVYANANATSDGVIIVMVPMGAMTGPITLVSTNGKTMTGTFTVTP